MIMNVTLKLALFSWVSLTALGTVGCKVTECVETLPDGGSVKKENCLQFQPTVEYRDARKREGATAWTSGTPVSITNQNGPVEVALGNAGDDRVQFSGIAFTRETNDAAGQQKATDHLSKMADPSINASSGIVVAGPGGGVDGYDLQVFLPPTFDGALTITTRNGKTTVHNPGAAANTVITSHEIVFNNMRGTVNLHSEVGDITAFGVPSGKGNVIKTDLGDVKVTLGATNLGITAQVESGEVIFPMGWNTMLNPDKKAGSATLGDGSGTLTVNATRNITFYAQ
jgi:hypothetical protein